MVIYLDKEREKKRIKKIRTKYPQATQVNSDRVMCSCHEIIELLLQSDPELGTHRLGQCICGKIYLYVPPQA